MALLTERDDKTPFVSLHHVCPAGLIPEALGELYFLQTMNLHGNALHGEPIRSPRRTNTSESTPDKVLLCWSYGQPCKLIIP